MKIINTAKNKKPIQWFCDVKSDQSVVEKLLDYKDIINSEGTNGIKKVNSLLNIRSPRSFKVSKIEIKNAGKNLSNEIKASILEAAGNIEKICQIEKSKLIYDVIETTKGIKIWKEFRPIGTVGLYVPGGETPLISSLLMQLIPAKIAECKNIVICTPPNKEGKVAEEILWIAKKYNISKVYKVGGSQAIFAMAYGNTLIPKVEKIFGPGNQYVNLAKQIVTDEVDIDLPAGPSEVMVVSNSEEDYDIIAADLLSQLEHGTDSKAFLLSNNIKLINKVQKAVQDQARKLTRKKILQKSLDNLLLIKTKSKKDTIKLINECAPEHLILFDDNYSSLLPFIENAGSIFCGKYSPESFGDYASGTNHVLPTNGKATTKSGLGIKDFGKQISVQTSTSEGFQNLSETVLNLSKAEKLDAHTNAVSIRNRLINKNFVNRKSLKIRNTNETKIFISLNLDGTGNSSINTGIKYFDHLLEQFAKHGKFDLMLDCQGDLEIDEHHSIEDIAITLGEAIFEALGSRTGIKRYANNEVLVMDEVKSSISIDLSTRRYLSFKTSKLREKVGEFPSEMFKHFFISLINGAAMTCHIETKGENSHHILEATFKNFGRALCDAVTIETNQASSTKGIL